jgi:MFS family permease
MFADARGVLRRNRDFRRLFVASLVSMIGDWFSFVAVAGLLNQLTHSTSVAGYAYAAMVLPIFFASPIAGSLADRMDRRTMMIVADIVRVPMAASLVIAAHYHSVPLLLTAVVLLGVAAAFSDPVASAALPNLVNDQDLPTAQAMFSASWGSMLIVGAALGGLTSAYLGHNVAFVVDAMSFLTSAFVLWRIQTPMQTFEVSRSRAATPIVERTSKRSGAGPGHGARANERTLGAGPGHGARANERTLGAGQLPPLRPYLRSSPAVMRLLLAKIGVSCANGIVGLLPGLAIERFAGNEKSSGFLFAARGLGALCGPVLARRVAGNQPSLRGILWICGISTMTYAAAYALLPLMPWFIGVMMLVAIAHLGGGAQWTMSSYGLQRLTPDQLRGRVMSIDYALATFTIGASALVAVWLADATSIQTAIWILTGFAGCFGIGWGAFAWNLKPSDEQRNIT